MLVHELSIARITLFSVLLFALGASSSTTAEEAKRSDVSFFTRHFPVDAVPGDLRLVETTFVKVSSDGGGSHPKKGNAKKSKSNSRECKELRKCSVTYEKDKLGNSKGSSKKQAKLLQSAWEKFADCRCSAFKLHPGNELGVSLCYQIGWYNKDSGKFGGEVIVYSHSKKKQHKSLRVELKFPSGGPRIIESDMHSKKKSGWFSFGPMKNATSGVLTRIHFTGELCKNSKRAGVASPEALMSPSNFRLVSAEGTVSLKRGADFANLPMTDTATAPFGKFAKLTDGRAPNTPNVPTTTPETPVQTDPATPTVSDTPAVPTVTAAPEDPEDPESQDPTGSSPGNNLGQPPASKSASKPSSTATAAAAAQGSDSPTPAPAAAGIPGQELSGGVIGFIVFGGLLVIASAIVGYNTWERRGYRLQFRRRNRMVNGSN